MSCIGLVARRPFCAGALFALGLSLWLMVASGPSAWAAIIGPTMDWEDFRTLAEKEGISEEMVDEILAAGVNIHCPGSEKSTANSWFLEVGGEIAFFGNAHLFYHAGQAFSDCFGQSLLDLDNSSPPTFARAMVEESSVVVASTDWETTYKQLDRARFSLKAALPLLRPLAAAPALPRLEVGDEVFAVSRRVLRFRESEEHRAPMAMKATIRKVIPDWRGMPGGILTDLDSVDGCSGALLFVRDPANSARLVPVAMVQGAFEGWRNGEGEEDKEILDYLPFNMKKNSGLALTLDEFFFKF